MFWLYDGNLSFIITAVAIDRQAISYLYDRLIVRLSRTHRKQWKRKQRGWQMANIDIITRLQYFGKSQRCSTSNAPLRMFLVARWLSVAALNDVCIDIASYIKCDCIKNICVQVCKYLKRHNFAYLADGIILLAGVPSTTKRGRSALVLSILYLL